MTERMPVPPDAAFAAGKEHVAMTGGEYHGLVAWLRTNGHPDLEDQLMRIKLLGDKKYQLCKYLKETFPHGLGAPMPTTPPQYHAPQSQAEVWVNEAPMQQPQFEQAVSAQPEPQQHYVPPTQPATDPRTVANQSIMSLEQVCQAGIHTQSQQAHLRNTQKTHQRQSYPRDQPPRATQLHLSYSSDAAAHGRVVFVCRRVYAERHAACS